jgi:dipeptidyl aminopeptidase/acylaminoacyl peptidase
MRTQVAGMLGVAGALVLLGGMAFAGPVAAPVAMQAPSEPGSPTIAQFMKLRVPGGVILSESGTLYVSDFPDGITQLYRVDGGEAGQTLAGPKATYVKQTQFPDGVSGVTLSPDGKTMLAMAAKGGNERTQVYLVKPSPAGSKDAAGVSPLIANEKANISPNFWLKDSSGFIYTANDTSPNDFYIYRYDLAAPEGSRSKLLLGKPGSWGAADATDSGSRYLVGEYRSASDSDIYELDAASGSLTKLNPSEAPHANELVGYMPGEKSVLLISDMEAGRARLFQRELPAGKPSKPIPSLDDAEINEASISPDRSLLAVVLNLEGYGELRLFTLPGFEPVPLPEMEKGLVSGVRWRGRTLFYSLSNSRQPSIAYAYKVPENTRNKMMPIARQLTAIVDDQGIDLSKLALPELIKFKSFDGLEVPAFLYLPAGAKKGTPVPFVIDFHGGPEGQHRPGFDRVTQFLLTRGYGVLKPNIRGSTGYGREFQMMDDYKKRWDSVKDGVEAARWLVREGYSSAGKIAATGGSYGGFMASAVAVEDGGSEKPVFGASATVVGIVNVRTFLEQTSGYRRKLREAEYGPLSDPEFLDSISSIRRVDQIKIPMMIAHGLNDPRVPIGEAMQLAVALKKRGMDPVEMYFPDEGHGFAKLENRLLYSERLVKFLDATIGSSAGGKN